MATDTVTLQTVSRRALNLEIQYEVVQHVESQGSVVDFHLQFLVDWTAAPLKSQASSKNLIILILVKFHKIDQIKLQLQPSPQVRH